jgi:hypothetical protein
VIAHLEDRKRYFYSTYQTKIFEAKIRLLEQVKINKFLYPASELDQDILEKKEITILCSSHGTLYNMKGAFIDPVSIVL